MRTAMTKESFDLLLRRLSKSGLSVSAFCRNEAYSIASFYYWKKKFNIFSSVDSPIGVKDHAEDFAPLSFPVSQSTNAVSTAEDYPKGLNEIMIELPVGVKIHFRGACESAAAMRFINQIYSSHVLSE